MRRLLPVAVLAVGLVALVVGVLPSLEIGRASSDPIAETADVPAPEVGGPAPSFELPDTYGQAHTLEQYRGKWVVLEWVNYGCPYVNKHYRTGNIPEQQEKWRNRGVVWLAVVSSAPGEQGHYEAAAMNVQSEEMGSNASAVLLDPAGTAGRMYNAMTTPHMFVIDPEGTLAYMGGIDDVPTPRDQDLARATQLVDVALEEATTGQPISTPSSQPYGCNVKYR